jgi:uncharacterized protein (DUF302 family)
MRISTFVLALVFTTGIPIPGRADAALITIESRLSVSATMDRVASILKDRGIAVAARIDHAAAARAAGLKLPDTEVILFGNPKIGTPLMAENPEIAIDLPMRIAVWQASDGRVLLGYTQPAELLARYDLAERREAIETMTKVLAAVAGDAIGP